MPKKTVRNYAKDKDAAAKLGIFQKIAAAEKKYGIPQGMLAGLAEQESDHFDPRVLNGTRKSSAGAQGLMQFMPATAKGRGVDPYNLDSAIEGSAKYLSELKNSKGSWNGALTSYNWGPGNYTKWLNGKKKSIPKEAREYAGRVMTRAQTYGSLLPALVNEQTKDLMPPPPQLTENLIPDDAIPDTLIPKMSPQVNEVSNLMPEQSNSTVQVDTANGFMDVIPQSPIEESLVKQLSKSGEQQLLTQVPELLSARKTLNSKKLLNRNDTMDQILGDLIDKA